MIGGDDVGNPAEDHKILNELVHTKTVFAVDEVGESQEVWCIYW